jgi:hypothetical protein
VRLVDVCAGRSGHQSNRLHPRIRAIAGVSSAGPGCALRPARATAFPRACASRAGPAGSGLQRGHRRGASPSKSSIRVTWSHSPHHGGRCGVGGGGSAVEASRTASTAPGLRIPPAFAPAKSARPPGVQPAASASTTAGVSRRRCLGVSDHRGPQSRATRRTLRRPPSSAWLATRRSFPRARAAGRFPRGSLVVRVTWLCPGSPDRAVSEVAGHRRHPRTHCQG